MSGNACSSQEGYTERAVCTRNQSCNVDYITVTPEYGDQMSKVREAFVTCEETVRGIVGCNREASVGWTNFEQACQWFIKSLAVDSKFQA